MSNCPVCQSEYLEGTVNLCPTCGWDLTLPVLGETSDALQQKQRSHLNWAKQNWSRSIELQQLLAREKAARSQLIDLLARSSQDEQIPSLQITDFLANLTEHLALFQQQLDEAKDERKQLLFQLERLPAELDLKQHKNSEQQAEIEKLRQENAELTDKLAQANTEIVRWQIISPETIKLKNQLAQASTKISELQAELNKFKPPNLELETHREFSFNVVTVDSQGRKNSSQIKTARALIQELPGGILLEMVAIPGGMFWMGSPDTELERQNNESPFHKVAISPIYLGRFPVTQVQWQVVAGLPKVIRDIDSNPSHFKGNNFPVENISWYDALEFCARLTEYTKLPYRLPSEAEWEYACRAGTTSPFHFGTTIAPNLANYDGARSYGGGPKGEYRKKTTPVGDFQIANAFGLSDMHGNVWEWCADRWHDNYSGAPVDGSAWDDCCDGHMENLQQKIINDNDNNPRIVRGGSWGNDPWDCRSAFRGLYRPGFRYFYVGLRVACFPARIP